MSGRVKKAPAPRKKANGYKMPAPIATGEVIHDTIGKKKWRIGPSIGVGGFGEIYSACDHESSSKGSNFPFVVKIEPHENGPLFVEKHFYVRNANKDDIAKFTKNKKVSSVGMPTYYGNGSHDYKGEKYRYLVLERYGKDLWTLFKDCGRSFPGATVFQIGLQMLDVLEYIHSRGYVHADIKGANILLGLKKGTENQAYLVDFGLATRVNDKEFKPDPKCAHNGTIEYTSRDAHLGVATMRGDLEILGYNMLQWLVGELPWEKSLKTPKTVQDMKEAFMKNVRANITKLGTVPDALIKYFEYINTLKPKDVPDYTKCCNLFESYLKGQGKTRNSKLEFTSGKNRKTSKGKVVVEPSESEEEDAPLKLDKKRSQRENGDVKKIKRDRPAKVIVKDSESESENCENETPNGSIESTRKLVKKTKVVRSTKRKSVEPLLSGKKAKLTPKPTPPIKKNHVNMATQTSGQKTRKSPRQVSFDSPICEIIGDRKAEKVSKKSDANTSRDIFEDSPEMVPRRKLISDEKVTVKRVVKKKTTIVKAKPRSWKDVSTIVNGRATPS